MEEMSSTITEVAQNTHLTSTSINTAYDLPLKAAPIWKANTQKWNNWPSLLPMPLTMPTN